VSGAPGSLDRVDAACTAIHGLRHEFGIFMEGVASWFLKHPELSGSNPPVIHSVKSRIKDEDHIREKIARKASTSDPIGADNVLQRITDVAGVRVLHLHQAQFRKIHECVSRKIEVLHDWVLFEPVKAYTWDPESKEFFQSLGLECYLKESFYTSVHYVIRPRIDSPLTCEIQVRTLFEEIWGEIDHAINYPEHCSIKSAKEQLKVLAKVVGAGSRLVDSIIGTVESPDTSYSLGQRVNGHPNPSTSVEPHPPDAATRGV
jgi:putative GTP pyrophosphokinase